MMDVLAGRLDEDLSLVEELLAMVPEGADDWRPDWPGERPFSVAELAAHLVESAGGLCACFARLHPSQGLRKVEEYGRTPAESLAGLSAYRRQLQSAGAETRDTDLGRVIPTYFVPAGEPFLAVLLTNWKHFNHHAYQLFIYLKLLGVGVSTRHLYRFRSAP